MLYYDTFDKNQPIIINFEVKVMQILVVEDEHRLAKALKQILEEKQLKVDTVFDGEDAYEYGKCPEYDCIVLDVMLPKMDGLTVAKKLRGEGIKTPIIMLTARDSVRERIIGLESGADDYMTKPFSPDELVARIHAVTRRVSEFYSNTIEIGDFVYDGSTNSITKGEKSIRLNYKEAEIIKYLFQRKNIIASKEDLINKIWGFESDAGDSNVEAYISFVRRKISFINSNVQIISYKKLGYRLNFNKCSEN